MTTTSNFDASGNYATFFSSALQLKIDMHDMSTHIYSFSMRLILLPL